MKNKKTNEKNAEILDFEKFKKHHIVVNKKGVVSSIVAATLLMGGAAGGITYLVTRNSSGGGSTPVQPVSDKCVVTFDSNGGSLVESKQVEKGKLLTLPTAPTKKADSSSYEFLGWYTDSALTIKFNESTPINSDMVLYAKWDIPITTKGLGYVLNSNNDGFEVYCSNIEELPSIVKIPETYTDESGKTLPVTGIYYRQQEGDQVSANKYEHTLGFWACSNLIEIELPDTITTIPNWAFQFCSKLQRVKLSNNLKYIEKSAFNQCYALKEVNFPESLLYIGQWSFYGCTALQKIILPDSLLEIKEHAFGWCPEVKEIVIGNNLQTIPQMCFAYNYNLRKVTISNSVTVIYPYAFYCSFDNYVSNTELVLEDGYSEWYHTNSKTTLSDATGVKNKLKEYDAYNPPENIINENAVTQPDMIHKVSYKDDTTNFYFQFVGYEETENDKIPICAISLNGDSNDPKIPASLTKTLDDGTQKTLKVRKISQYGFSDKTKLEKITIPSFITSIGNRAFDSTGALSSITIEEGSELEHISNYAFVGTNLNKLNSDTDGEINLPEGIISLGSSAFKDCEEIKKVSIPSTLTNLYFDDYEYYLNDNDELKWNYCHPFSGCKIQEYVVSEDNPNFMSVNKAIYSKVIKDGVAYPEKLLDYPIHTQTDPATTEEYQINIPNGIKSIASTAFNNVEKYNRVDGKYHYIVNLTLPSSLKELNSSLSYISCLKSINVDQNNEYFESETDALYNKGKTELIKFFNYYTSAQSCTYTAPSTLKSIRSYAFYHSWHNFDEFKLNEGLEEISGFSFYQLDNQIKKINFPSTLKYVSYYTFCDEDYCYHPIANNSTIYVDSLYLINNAYANSWNTWQLFDKSGTVYISKDIDESKIDSSFTNKYEKTATESGNYWKYTKK